MDYSKIINDNGFYLYKDDSFYTICLQMGFLREKGNFEDAAYELLSRYIMKTNKNYKTEYDLNKREIDLYSIEFSTATINMGSQNMLFFCFDIVSPTAVHDYSKEAFKFVHEMIFEPDFTNEKVFNNIKESYLSALLNNLSQPGYVANSLFLDRTFGCEDRKYRYSTDLDYIKNMIDSITLKDIEELYYKTVREENFVRGLAFGNITDEEFKTLRENFNYKRDNTFIDCSEKYDFVEEDVEVSDENANESTIFITYDIDNMDPGTRKIINEIFNGSCDLCMNILREKYGLVYTSGVLISYVSKYLVIKAKIDKNNKDKFIEAVDEMMRIVQDKKSLEELLQNAKDSIKIDYELIDESRDEMILNIDNYISGIFNGFDDVKFAEDIYGVKVEDVLKCTKTLKRKKIFLYRGDLDE